MTEVKADDHRLTRLKRFAHKVRQTKGGYSATRDFYDSMSPELVLALVECADTLRELYSRKVPTIIPEDPDFQRASVALARLEGECLPLI